uniref:C-type lectin domain-containing protein n=1 Tax=Anabas testudineus TaxID=64144 RepID=A0A7N6B9I9_ANATE
IGHLSIFTLGFIFGLSLFVQAFLQKKIYFSVSNKATWSEAHSYCMEHYTDLATFQTKNELDTLESLLGLDTVYWIGLQKVNNVWIWSDGQEVTFTQWSREEPKKNGNDDCAVMRGGSWYDASCNVNVAFLCYEPLISKRLNHSDSVFICIVFQRYNFTPFFLSLLTDGL